MKNNELPKSLFDIILKNSNSVRVENTDAKAPPKSTMWTWLGFILAPFIFSVCLYFMMQVLSEKFSIPHFSYMDCFKVYLGILVISQLLIKK